MMNGNLPTNVVRDETAIEDAVSCVLGSSNEWRNVPMLPDEDAGSAVEDPKPSVASLAEVCENFTNETLLMMS